MSSVEPEAEEGLDLIKAYFRYQSKVLNDPLEDFDFIRDRRRLYVLGQLPA